MRIVSRGRLRDFWEKHPDSEQPLKAWFYETKKAKWKNPAEVRKLFGSADFVGDRTVFNIGGNKYRLVVLIDYERHGILIRFIGTHKQYDKIDVNLI
tara:strand:- start:4927 stop:5217 length:291 start_codon:yes stop_codon:yes gene_type:complete